MGDAGLSRLSPSTRWLSQRWLSQRWLSQRWLPKRGLSKSRRPTRWLRGIGLALLSMLVLGVILGWAIMGRVCTDAKPRALQSYRELPFFQGLPPVLNIAHRGASTLAPEHSFDAFELALAQGAHVLELDLRLLRDGELVVAHDRTLKRTHGVDAAYSELSWPELERLGREHTPLRLAPVFTRFSAARFNLELKDESLEAARALAARIAESGVEDRVLVASGHERVLAEFRELTAGRVATSASAAEALRYWFCQLLGRSCAVAYSALQLPASDWLGVTRASFIARAHERGLAVHFWTVDAPDRMQALLAAGADGIMTNRPDVLAPLLDVR